MIIKTCPFLLLILLSMGICAFGYGSTGPIAAAFGENGFFCAIDASGKQEVICWEKDNNKSSSSSSTSAFVNSLPPMSALSGGEGFMCGITSNTSQAYCWVLSSSGIDLVPPGFKYNSYTQISAGMNQVCAIRGSYASSIDYGFVDCWEINQTSSNTSHVTNLPNPMNDVIFSEIVSGDGFNCGVKRDGGGTICWGPNSGSLKVTGDVFKSLVSGRDSVCGIFSDTGGVKCLGNAKDPPVGVGFVALSAGDSHFCGIREDNHGIECWGSVNSSSIPKGSGFTDIASSDFTACGVREADFVLDCWDVDGKSPPNYSPPLQLCSPGVCSSSSCGSGKFAFNASILNEPELTSLCVEKDLKICLPCGSNCSEGFFPSSVCSENADRVCTACTLCQNSSCQNICKLPSSSKMPFLEQHEIKKLLVIVGSSISGLLVVLIGWCLFPRWEQKNQVVEADSNPELQISVSINSTVGAAQVFRLSEVKDSTNGFKEFNELGRGSYGFVYKATLSDGSQVAVKRANAATIIHTNSREFEAELEILCSIRHGNVVNLLGYCAEMGERLLVYEFMPHGTLHDHLHGELSPLDWSMRLQISLQAARGLEYLHVVATPPIVHRDIKTSNILLDSNWEARIADFGLLSVSDRILNGNMENDVYNFGIVLLEILSGRKAYDRDHTPPSIVEWALPSIRRGRAAAVIDRNVALPRNVEPLLKLADIAELSLKENPNERPVMSDVVVWLDQIVKTGLTF